MSLLSVLTKGGWMMIPIALSSIVVVALGVSRFLTLRKLAVGQDSFLREWRDRHTPEFRERFLSACRLGPAAFRAMADAAEKEADDHHAALAVEAAARQELSSAESGLGTMATLAAVTPLMGFLGTVTGMIRAFMQIQNLGGNVNANVLAGGIWEALVTTAAGLAVGIVALVLHNYLAGMVKEVTTHLEAGGDLILRHRGDRSS